MKFRDGRQIKHGRRRKLAVVVAFFGVVFLFSYGFYTYQSLLKPIDTNNDSPVVVTIDQGLNDSQIGELLQKRGLIKSSLAYQIFIRLGSKKGSVQAGSYTLSKSMDVRRIIDKLSSGEVTVELLTILPGKRIDELKQTFIDAGYTEDEVETALDPTQYAEHPALRDKEPTASLEGYLYPESFQRTASTPLSVIITASLDQMALQLDDTLQKKLFEKGLSLREAIILASIVEKEVSNPTDKPTVAQVFLSRYSLGMLLGSDVTAYYGATISGLPRAVSTDTPYNTRLYAGLPPGPISNFSASSLDAIANPSNTDYLYFVAGDDGVTYFSHTLEEHEALTQAHCKVLCAIP